MTASGIEPEDGGAGQRPISWRRWPAARPILDAALDMPSAERWRFVEDACGDDAELKGVVTDLLHLVDRTDAPDEAAVGMAYPRLVQAVLGGAPPAAGSSATAGGGPGEVEGEEQDHVREIRTALAGRYAIEREVGSGGMASVYLAHDVRHDRRVALKVLRPELSAIIGVGRFLSEIRTTANLQHPHILPLHDSGEVNGAAFYVMPYVEGGSLRRRLSLEKLLPVDVALSIAAGVASALDYAHRVGIVHRDIKPENILLQDGQALVADFGIALAVSSGAGRMTETGMSLGTPTYMSPEQAMGERNLDGRADIYALACVLYEMLTGEPPHVGPTAQAIVAKVLTAQPVAPRMLRTTIPPHVEAAILVGLQKLPADRFATAAAFAAALERPAPGAPPAAATSRSARLRSWRFALPLAALAGVGLWGWLRPLTPRGVASLTKFSLAAEAAPAVPDIALSPDGSSLVYLGRDAAQSWSLMLRRLDAEERMAIPGSQGASQPFFSPDGHSVGFLQDGRLRRVSLSSGEVTTVVDVSAMEGSGALNQVMYGAAWGPGNAIVFATPRGLFMVNANGGVPRAIAAPDSAANEWYLVQPAFTNDGAHVLVDVVSRDYESRIALVPLSGGRLVSLGVAGREPKQVTSGQLVYTDAQGRLFTIGLDVRRRRVTGEARQVLENVALLESPSRAFVDVSRSGTIAYVARAEANDRELVLVDRLGRAERINAVPHAWRHPRFSPDGRRIAVGVDAAGASGDVWVLDLSTHRLVRLTFDSLSIHPSWSADGRFVIVPHPRLRGGRSALLRIRADGSAGLDSLLSWPRQIWEAEVTPDGRRLVFRDDNPRTIRDIYVVPIDTPSAPRVLLGSALSERSIAVSPSGDWIAFVSNASGRDEVYLRRLAPDSPHWPVSVDGGSEPRWARGTGELFFRHGDTVLVAAVRLSATPAVTRPQALFTGDFQSSPHQALFDVSPDGARFVMVRSPRTDAHLSIHLVLHWFERSAGEPSAR